MNAFLFEEKEKEYTAKVLKVINKQGSVFHDHINSLLESGKIFPDNPSAENTISAKFIKELLQNTSFGEIEYTIEATPTDVGDWLEKVKENITEQKDQPLPEDGYAIPSFESFFMQNFHENGNFYEEENNFREKILDILEKNFFVENSTKGYRILNELENNGLLFFKANIEEPNLQINFLMISPEEWNSDLALSSDIADTFMYCLDKGRELQIADIPSVEELNKSCFWRLLHQQGYSFQDLVENTEMNMEDNGYGDYFPAYTFSKESKFLKYLREEILEQRENFYGVLAFCGTMDTDALYKLFKHPENKICFNDSRTTFGLFDPSGGGGSLLSLEMEKPVVFPSSVVEICIEKSETNPARFHLIDDVYGMVGQVWEKEVLALGKDEKVPDFKSLPNTQNRKIKM